MSIECGKNVDETVMGIVAGMVQSLGGWATAAVLALSSLVSRVGLLCRPQVSGPDRATPPSGVFLAGRKGPGGQVAWDLWVASGPWRMEPQRPTWCHPSSFARSLPSGYLRYQPIFTIGISEQGK